MFVSLTVIHFAAAGDANGSVVDIYEAKGLLRGHQGRGSLHHIAFRSADATGADGREADPHARKAPDRIEGPQLFSLDLTPRARQCFVRDRD
jgi:hypothetical protein